MRESPSNAPEARAPRRERRAPSVRRRVWAFGAAALLAIALIATLSMRPLLSGRREVSQLQRNEVALQHVLDLRATLADWQLFMEPQIAKLGTAPAGLDPIEIAKGAQLAQLESAQTLTAADALRAVGRSSSARGIVSASTKFTTSLTALGPLIAGRPLAVIDTAINAERGAFAFARAVTATEATALRHAIANGSRLVVHRLEAGRTTVLVTDVAAALLAVGAAAVLGQRLRRRELTSRDSSRRRRYETTLQQALEMAKTEADTYTIMARGLRETVPHLQVEMLVADSSRAHFHQTLQMRTDAAGSERSGCGVVSPADCPATQRGHTLRFPSSRDLNACPYLVGRASGELSAGCVAISFTGQSSGVVHATGPDGVPPTDRDVGYLELTSRHASERIAMLRAFEKSEVQARTDPLTGLWNRRSLENRINELQRDGTPYTLAYGDLDHFKLLNDTYGHEAGDQALRLFSRVLRDSVRPSDITARYGGEEFVVVLPECDVETAATILERLRERLLLSLVAGRTPAFTVSFGIASSLDADTFDEVVATADRALLRAKTNGRNRTVLASEPAVSAPLVE
jgi:diguanylate cyclase (GGDEF)-like protein